ncbi:endonuclease/exonuclease/phosphatase family protein [Roseivirga sp. BDSF3-8]|uniref:endonuclease/exonuclease/phosphatase family protein n=1 Tax=Roseivirga sp. BDSF3-8 TaxID=3241598 RepID=UPI003531DB9C
MKTEAILRVVFRVLALFILLATLVPLLTSEEWFIRAFDFPRLQFAGLTVITIGLMYSLEYHHKKRAKVWLLLLLVAFCYHGYKIYPYTKLSPFQTLYTENDRMDTVSFGVLVSNVLQTNTDYDRLLEQVEMKSPDVVLVLEADAGWEKGLLALEDNFPYTIKMPLDNTYGMLMYSQLPVKDGEVRFLVEHDIPSIHAQVQLRNNSWFTFYGVHPRPPAPGESDDSRERDAEIVMIGKKASEESRAVIVAGDFNDVAWSATTRLFQEVSGLLDPRIGRGFYNTFHAKNVLFRWPLDHIFHSKDFKLIRMEVLEGIGSDHFPIYAEFSYEPIEQYEQESVEKDDSTDREAEQTIQEGLKDEEDD